MENNLNNTITVNEPRAACKVADDEIDLRELFTVIWLGKWVIVTIATLFAVVSVVYVINQPDIYTSEALLAPAEQDKSGGLGALGGQLGGLASLAGVNLGGSSNNKSQLAIEILKSRQFSKSFIQEHDILPDLMAVKAWNSETNTVVYDEELYVEAQNKWVREVDAPYKPKPSMQEAYKEFSEIITVKQDDESGMVTIGVEHISPYIAQQWVNWLIEDINQTMKQRDVLEANESTNFLTNQLQQTKVADIRAVLYNLVEEQTKTIMFANVRDEYVFKTVDPAIVPEEKSGPKRALICIISVLFGAFLGAFFVLIKRSLKKD